MTYQGSELELFQHALNWKSYWSGEAAPFVKGEVLEVGAGIGANTHLLMHSGVSSITCLEPDPALCAQFPSTDARIRVAQGTTASIQRQFDSICYIDVLEHIEDDRGEAARAALLLRPGGFLVVLSPAHQFLYSPFDKAIGHFRRYSRNTLRAVTPPQTETVRMDYLDSAGLSVSLANRFVLSQSIPTQNQILFWDRGIVPISRRLDRLIGFSVGKSILGVWRKI